MRGEKYLVVIPYLPTAAQGRELEFALHGWTKHFKEDFEICVVGDGVPVFDGIRVNSVEVWSINSPRVEPVEGQYRQHLDYVSCIQKVYQKFPQYEGFIFTADDNFAVNNFRIEDIRTLKQQSPDCSGNAMSRNGWQRDKAKTYKLLKSLNAPTRNFTTHLPCWYYFDLLINLYDEFKMDRNSYVIEDLYFNLYYWDFIPLQLNINYDNQRCAIWRSNPDWDLVRKSLSSKMWIVCSPEGYQPELEKILSDHYGI